jgi:ribosomal protein S18 acetylase RimI-like enzyme
MHPAIRKADVEDAGILSVLATEVWLDTYATEGVSPAFAAHLLEEYSPGAFTEALLNRSIHMFVYTAGNFVKGYLKLTTEPAALDLRYGTVELATLYVRRHHKRQGIGTELLRHAMDVAAADGHRSMYLTVHHANRDALVFYES